MSEKFLIRQCSPTLAGIKTGSLFSCPYRNKKELWKDIRRMNARLSHKGVRIIPLRLSSASALIYIYRTGKLSKDLQNQKARRILDDCGYTSSDVPGCLSTLIKKLKSGESFPHEIGLFLGYPPDDVSGFIKNGAHGAKLTGYWKVYEDPENAQKTFESYNTCTKVYADHHAQGVSIERLTVAGI